MSCKTRTQQFHFKSLARWQRREPRSRAKTPSTQHNKVNRRSQNVRVVLRGSAHGRFPGMLSLIFIMSIKPGAALAGLSRAARCFPQHLNQQRLATVFATGSRSRCLSSSPGLPGSCLDPSLQLPRGPCLRQSAPPTPQCSMSVRARLCVCVCTFKSTPEIPAR